MIDQDFTHLIFQNTSVYWLKVSQKISNFDKRGENISTFFFKNSPLKKEEIKITNDIFVIICQNL